MLPFSYVDGKGWQHYFKTYCIPEDLVPRILSPAYFHHYNSQNLSGPANIETSPSVSKYKGLEKQKADKLKENESEQLVLGLGPVQNPFWRLSRLVPIEGLRRQFSNKEIRIDIIDKSVVSDSAVTSALDDIVTAPQSLEIEEGCDGISLRPLPERNEDISGGVKNEKTSGTSYSTGDKRGWRRIPSLPSYVPFGQVRLSTGYFPQLLLVLLVIYLVDAILLSIKQSNGDLSRTCYEIIFFLSRKSFIFVSY